MIRSYGDAETRRFALGAQTKKFEAFRRQLEKTLDRLDAAASLRDIVNFPGHHLERLGADRARRYSIRVDHRWRICFDWPEGSHDPENVTIEI
jgi:proteic killer suppression protein